MKSIRMFAVAYVTLFLLGCAGLAEMEPVQRVIMVADDEVLVTFVKPRVFQGDGIKQNFWDGESFIGTLNAGSMMQYVTTPGYHIFISDCIDCRWVTAAGDLEGGKSYYIKFNAAFVSVNLGVADKNDPRIPKWNKSLNPIAINQEKFIEIPVKIREKVKKTLMDAKNGIYPSRKINSSHAYVLNGDE